MHPSPVNTTILLASGVIKQVESPGGVLTIVDGVDLVLAREDTLAIIGASGSGKSTLLGVLAGLDLPSAGRVEMFGNDLAREDEDGRARLRAGRVGFVFQSFQLLSGMTALENVMLPLELAGAADAAARAHDWLARVGLTPRSRHLPRQLSGGEQQRVALARAFVTAPELLFADEPTGNLDAVNAAQIADLLFELHAHSGTALVLVTHDEKLAARCSRHVRMVQGRLEAV